MNWGATIFLCHIMLCLDTKFYVLCFTITIPMRNKIFFMLHYVMSWYNVLCFMFYHNQSSVPQDFLNEALYVMSW